MINEKELEKWFELQKKFNNVIDLHLRAIDEQIKFLGNEIKKLRNN